MLEKGDLVSIVIPAYNTEKYIKPMIESLKAQTYRKLLRAWMLYCMDMQIKC